MFDYVRCRYPLPHHQDALFQTKNLLSLVDPGDEGFGGLMENYEITEDGRLRRQRHKYKAVKTPRQFPSFHLKSIKSWWTTVSNAHGDILIYTSDDTGKRGRRWIEFRIRFTNGRVQDVDDRSRASLIGPQGPAGSRLTRTKPADRPRRAPRRRSRHVQR